MKYLCSPKIILIFILLLGLFFRVYKLEIFYSWGHDQDLFAWIARDIVVDHHLRLIGQETSITGVFIGPIFYYLIAISLVLFNMNPLAASIPTTIISLLTIFSIYWVFTKFFGEKVGLIGSFLYAISPGIILLDRWVVPTQPTTLWCIWYLYSLLSIIKGKLPLIVTSVLIGLIWHVHVAFIPLLLLLPVALWLSWKQISKFMISARTIIISVIFLFVLILPFFTFELRHGFQQVKGLTQATYEEKGDVKGIDRIIKVFNTSGRAISGIILLDKNISVPKEFYISFPILLFISFYYLYKKRVITKNHTIIFSLWLGIDLIGQFISKRPIPEYYFSNIFVVLFLTLATLISTIKLSQTLRFIPVLLLGIFLTLTTFWIITQPDDQEGYLQKRKSVEYIKSNADLNDYPCVAINYIEAQKGLPNGYRYLFWLNNLKIITPGNDVPVYSIVTPWTISEKEIIAKFGNFGIINPAKKEFNPKICSDPNRQLLPLWGFTN